MVAQMILVIILLSNIRKKLKLAGKLAKWEQLLIGGIILCSVFIALGTVFQQNGQVIVAWFANALTATVLYYILTNKELAFAKSLLYAFLPILGINFIQDVVQLIDRPFYKEWDDYFEIAELFGFVWMVAMLIMTNKQNKALERERRISEEKEKEFKITEKLKAELEIQVNERTAELTKQKEELQQTLHELEATQTQLIHSEKMASLGELTAGIAHEIQNPLNFVNNFSEINQELLAELKEEMAKGNVEEANLIANDLIDNEKKINHHGKRADSIVKGMLQHSRTSTGQKEPTDINALCDECLRLSYHGLRAKDKTFNSTFETSFDSSIPKLNIVPQEIGRVLLNLCNNGFYAVNNRKKTAGAGYKPLITIRTKNIDATGVEIQVTDNGSGIPPFVIDKIFQPFFTTKPTGEGTGLGLSMSYDIVTKGHNGSIIATSEENTGTTFTINLPYTNS